MNKAVFEIDIFLAFVICLDAVHHLLKRVMK